MKKSDQITSLEAEIKGFQEHRNVAAEADPDSPVLAAIDALIEEKRKAIEALGISAAAQASYEAIRRLRALASDSDSGAFSSAPSGTLVREVSLGELDEEAELLRYAAEQVSIVADLYTGMGDDAPTADVRVKFAVEDNVAELLSTKEQRTRRTVREIEILEISQPNPTEAGWLPMPDTMVGTKIRNAGSWIDRHVGVVLDKETHATMRYNDGKSKAGGYTSTNWRKEVTEVYGIKYREMNVRNGTPETVTVEAR